MLDVSKGVLLLLALISAALGVERRGVAGVVGGSFRLFGDGTGLDIDGFPWSEAGSEVSAADTVKAGGLVELPHCFVGKDGSRTIGTRGVGVREVRVDTHTWGFAAPHVSSMEWSSWMTERG